jgi:hypothetical protein
MATNSHHLNLRSAASRVAVAAVLALAACSISPPTAAAVTPHKTTCKPPASASYGWPLRPFHTQHAVRGFFGDPRIARGRTGVIRSFHFGIDIAGDDGTPVYATLTGRVRGGNSHHDVVAIAGSNGRVFSYWHVVPAVRRGAHVVAYKTLIGHIAPTWGHVHFAEFRSGTALNPLRPGALGPYADTMKPLITGLGLPQSGLAEAPVAALTGPTELVVEAHDNPQMRVPSPWDDLAAAPALVRWRIDHQRWVTAVDFRKVVPKPDAYDAAYAYHTHQNRPHRRGHYLIYLARSWDPSNVAPGRHSLHVMVADIRGNTATASVAFTIAGEGS